jgi:hypothetical protein
MPLELTGWTYVEHRVSKSYPVVPMLAHNTHHLCLGLLNNHKIHIKVLEFRTVCYCTSASLKIDHGQKVLFSRKAASTYWRHASPQEITRGRAVENPQVTTRPPPV